VGGGFTLLPTILPQAQVGRLKVPRPIRANCFDCPGKCSNIETSQNRFWIDFESILEPIWGNLGLRFRPPTGSKMHFGLEASVNITANVRQPRNTVNIGSRSTCVVCVFPCAYTKNRLLELRLLSFFRLLLQDAFGWPPRRLLNTIFFKNYYF